MAGLGPTAGQVWPRDQSDGSGSNNGAICAHNSVRRPRLKPFRDTVPGPGPPSQAVPSPYTKSTARSAIVLSRRVGLDLRCHTCERGMYPSPYPRQLSTAELLTASLEHKFTALAIGLISSVGVPPALFQTKFRTLNPGLFDCRSNGLDGSGEHGHKHSNTTSYTMCGLALEGRRWKI